MKARLHALLVHGMGMNASFWTPLLSGLRRMEIEPHALEMPLLEDSGPEGWVTAILEKTAQLNGTPFVLIGHSLGSVACLHAAFQKKPEACILLASPLYIKTVPKPPPESNLSFNTHVKIAKFLRLPGNFLEPPFPTAHFLGECDQFISAEQAKELPFPLHLLPERKHNFLHHESARHTLLEYLASSPAGKKYLDPGILLSLLNSEGFFRLPPLDEKAPPPARLDVEITTHCQMSCAFCARTHQHDLVPSHMPEPVFQKILLQNSGARELIFVGLGEPLLHPSLEKFVCLASEQHLYTKLVTNGLLATPEKLSRLHRSGLKEITFSLDSTDPENFIKLRGGGSVETIQKNFLEAPRSLSKSLFVTVSPQNVKDLPRIIDFAEHAGLFALALSDLNFENNQKKSLHQNNVENFLKKAIEHARRKNIRLIGPHFHDVGQMPRDYRLCEVSAPSDLTERKSKHTHCLAPWRIQVVDVKGRLSPCNCAPFDPVISRQAKTLSGQWNSAGMQSWRKAMLQGVNKPCKSCPRY